MMSLLVWLNSLKKTNCENSGDVKVANTVMMGLKNNIVSPVSDCNSNNLPVPQDNLCLNSIDSMHDCPDFLHDNSDYQWVLDYGYKDHSDSHHQSIFSISRSQDLIYYEDLSRNFDANLAEVDMDDFKREDIHSVLSSLPNIPGVEEREMFASVTGSMMVKFGLDESMSPHSSSQEEANNITSMYKSQPLFSPVHESYIPNTNLSVDSLDLLENDISLMVTCQGNKKNYTIAFEESTIMGLDEMETKENCVIKDIKHNENESSPYKGGQQKNEEVETLAQKSKNAMTNLDLAFTTWSKIKKNSNDNLQLKLYSSGNNNISGECVILSNVKKISNTVKSMSMPNLFCESQKPLLELHSSIDLEKDFNFGKRDCRQQCIKLYDVQNSCTSKSVEHFAYGLEKEAHNFSLLKLFFKQKSGNQESNSHNPEEESNNRFKSKEKNSETSKNLKKETQDYRMNELNKAKTKYSTSKYCEQLDECLSQKIGEKKFEIYETKGAFDSNYENKYCSDESTQENGSNTESAENVICNCQKIPIQNNLKKIVAEKSIQTSKLLTSQESANMSKSKVPVYIFYPNYSLPDLEFLKKEHYVQNIDFSKVFMRPQNYQSNISQTSTPKNTSKRPFSVNDIKALKKTGFKHIRDWESLTFLLPKEYKLFLQEIPEIVSQLKDCKDPSDELMPLFYLSPPASRKLNKRPMSCDLNVFNNDYKNSNYSTPSSGYKGSSTMLNSNNSSNLNSTKNPPFAHKFEYDSEYGSSRKSGCFVRSKQLSKNSSETSQIRPPLPKGILRNNSLDSQQYTCKFMKENANKRYSMIELTENNSNTYDKYGRKRSAQNFNYPSPAADQSDRNVIDGIKATSKNSSKKDSRANDPEVNLFLGKNQTKIQNDLKRLEELLEISAAFGENIESFTESDMMKLRSQVSKFLTMQKNLEKVSETLQTVDKISENENCTTAAENKNEINHSFNLKTLHTPHNTPEHKKQIKAGKCDENHIRDLNNIIEASELLEDYKVSYDPLNDETVGLKKTVSFAEKISFAARDHSGEYPMYSKSFASSCQKMQKAEFPGLFNKPNSEESIVNFLKDSSTRNPLFTMELNRKKELVLDVKNAIDKIKELVKETQDDPTYLCLYHLCPSLYAVLNDGLKEEIDTPFGPLKNSVWNVIEASSQSGPMTQTLNELVQRLNRDDVFTEGLIKFNAFIFGLLNARALSGWFSYLRTKDSLLRKHYNRTGLLYMSNTAGASIRILVDYFINILESLNFFRFNLDLMHQTKKLHCSLQNLNHLLEDADNNAFLTPTKQLTLMKLVQSIQNSINQVGENKKDKKVSHDVEKKTNDVSAVNSLEKNEILRNRQKFNKSRPRSGCDILGSGKETFDVTTALKKRWSGVHSNSKLVEAFEKLGSSDESDYIDNLNIQNLPESRKKMEEVFCKTVMDAAKENSAQASADLQDVTKEQKKNILLNLNKKCVGKTDFKTDLDVKEVTANPTAIQSQKNGHKFKRLQQKWEQLSGKSGMECRNKTSRKAKDSPSEKIICDNNNAILQSPSSRTSKIPRLITSPSSTTQTPVLKDSKKVNASTTYIQKPTKKSTSTKGGNSEIKGTSIVTNRQSRCDEKLNTPFAGASGKSHATRPTSLTYKGNNLTSANKTEGPCKRTASASLNRKTTPKNLQIQRTVRTLTHRLPLDSGHLSFNEGEELKVVLDVDKTWLLCCRGNQKGLVPKAAVISDLEF